MALPRILWISGPAKGGKTTLVRRIARRLGPETTQFIRFVRSGQTHQLRLKEHLPEVNCARRVDYLPERIFEQLPDVVSAVGREGGCEFLFLETDPDSSFRLAHRYDLRVFVMGSPKYVHEVFRSTEETQQALRAALSDTGAFAREVFGMERVPGLDDSSTSLHVGTTRSAGMPADGERPGGDALGPAITARMQLHPDFQLIIDADVVVLNSGLSSCGETTDVCARRIEKLLASIPQNSARPLFLCCDIVNERDPLARRLFDTLHTGLTRRRDS